MNLSGLSVIVAKKHWTWTGFRELPSTLGHKVKERIERWSASCDTCGTGFVRAARLPVELQRKFMEERAQGNVLLYPLAQTMPELGDPRCRRCRVLHAQGRL